MRRAVEQTGLPARSIHAGSRLLDDLNLDFVKVRPVCEWRMQHQSRMRAQLLTPCGSALSKK